MKTETTEEYLARGGTITQVPARKPRTRRFVRYEIRATNGNLITTERNRTDARGIWETLSEHYGEFMKFWAVLPNGHKVEIEP